MARRRKQDESGLDLLFEVATPLPWQAGLVLAAAIFIPLHLYSSSPPPVLDQTVVEGRMNYVLATVLRSVAGIAKYLLPAVVLLGSLMSYMGSKRKKALLQQVAADPRPNALEQMSWADFEALVSETFRQKGFHVVDRGGAGPDGGVDLVLFLGQDKYLVQCKQWKTRQVGVSVVRELYGVMAAERAVGGFVVASGDFTPDAEAFAEGRSIELVDARKLRRLIGGHQATKPTTVVPTVTSPACPTCGGHMVERAVKKGPNAGKQFWGCAKFPACKGIRN